MSKNKPSLARGARDFGPEVTARRNYIIDTIKKNFIKYGFTQIETPALENLATLTGKYGDEGDKLLFKILNSGDFLKNVSNEDIEAGSGHVTKKISEKGLRYDLTVPFARFVVMNQNNITMPFKRFQIQPVWRADRPQKGRYREFYQCDADIIGSKGIWNEVELTLLLLDVYKDLNFEDFVIKVNHREVLFSMADYVSLESNRIAFCTEVDKLDKIGKEKVKENIINLGASNDNTDAILSIFDLSDQEDILEKLSDISENEGLDQLKSYFEQLNELSGNTSKVKLDPSLARGLSYYTGMIFEVKPTSVGIGSINGGGRYDDLTGVFGLKNVSGIGISFGLDRIYDVLEELKLFPDAASKKLDVLIVHFNNSCLKYGQKVVMDLRKSGIVADLYPDAVKIQKQFNYADKMKVPFAIIIGEEEMQTGNLSFKDMNQGNQEKLSLDGIIKKLGSKGT